MFENGFDFVENNKRKRKPERRNPARQWMGYDEFEDDFEAIKSRKSKHVGLDDDPYREQDPKRMVRKNARRKEKWAFSEPDY